MSSPQHPPWLPLLLLLLLRRRLPQLVLAPRRRWVVCVCALAAVAPLGGGSACPPRDTFPPTVLSRRREGVATAGTCSVPVPQAPACPPNSSMQCSAALSSAVV
eukprot:TRINITY_DN4301_c0_g1_i1.p3 TRINITY_DN4301_c0_g1~~TRINITY_DN4301_c0_g1_i1.p3  ORF type:complete len:104 (+),score=16.53 TRINITY_DN4301_c0_g1_i1:140-451(+)